MVKSQNYSSLSIQSSYLKKKNQIAKLDSLLWIWYQIELNCSLFIRKIFNFGKSKRSVPKFEETSSIETMAVTSDQDDATKICSHCDRAIPSTNMELHYFHCSRNLEKCKICGDMVPKKLAVEHYSTTHAPVQSSNINQHKKKFEVGGEDRRLKRRSTVEGEDRRDGADRPVEGGDRRDGAVQIDRLKVEIDGMGLCRSAG
ncbi:hypothetical protein R6Q59_019890 [Mikania micrantha]